MKNLEVAKMLYEIADILEAQDVQFKPRAYRNAARSIEELSEDIVDIWKRGELEEIPGVGENISKKIAEYLETGRLRYYTELKKEFPVNLEELGKVEGLGPKRAIMLYKKLGVRNLEDLKKAVGQHKIRELEGFGEKNEQKIAEGIGLAAESGKRMLLSQIMPMAQELERKLHSLKEVEKVDVVGSYRRRKETIGDLDILVVSKNAAKVMDFFTKIEDGLKVLVKGPAKSSVLLSSGLQVDLRVFNESDYGAAMLYFTGSKEHNIVLRTHAISKRMKLSEYGLFRGERKVAAKSEEEVYRALGLKQWIPPELRENMGEIGTSLKGKLPDLVELKDIRGDLHCHTDWSEGRSSIEEMAGMGKSLGYEYMIISDHGGTLVPIARCMNEKKILEQGKRIDALNKKLDGMTLLKGCETNIKDDGSIDVSNATLKTLDIATTAIHTKFKMPKKEMTKRIITAMENEHIDIIAHPTGRLIGSRAPLDFDFDEVLDAAKRTGTVLEINSYPERLDLDYLHIFKSRGKTRFTLGTDAHEKAQMRFMEFGVAQARRGWCEKKDILNALPLKELRKTFGF
ncbi:DNA polymerase/3'-5' exonuclease PolX [Candidatus Micrarchaeota archaeon]|nr:DNA polymerase/3'-5' exonuclease PolX [Candidatus Micrarchaeota archaeon]